MAGAGVRLAAVTVIHSESAPVAALVAAAAAAAVVAAPLRGCEEPCPSAERGVVPAEGGAELLLLLLPAAEGVAPVACGEARFTLSKRPEML